MSKFSLDQAEIKLLDLLEQGLTPEMIVMVVRALVEIHFAKDRPITATEVRNK